MVVYAETNFILEMGYRQSESEFCERIVELAENGRIMLTIPSFSIGESYETSYPDVCCFLNKNSKDFDTPNVRNELRPYDCRLIGNFEQGLNYISSTLGP